MGKKTTQYEQDRRQFRRDVDLALENARVIGEEAEVVKINFGKAVFSLGKTVFGRNNTIEALSYVYKRSNSPEVRGSKVPEKHPVYWKKRLPFVPWRSVRQGEYAPEPGVFPPTITLIQPAPKWVTEAC